MVLQGLRLRAQSSRRRSSPVTPVANFAFTCYETVGNE